MKQKEFLYQTGRCSKKMKKLLLYSLLIFIVLTSKVGYCEKFVQGELIIKYKEGIEADTGIRIIRELGKEFILKWGINCDFFL